MPRAVRNEQLGRLPCDAHHHHYHYQASAQYLWLAETLRALAREEEAHAAYDKAIFQDHGNHEAIERKALLRAIPSPWKGEGQGGGQKQSEKTPTSILPLPGGGSIKYNKHPALDAEFRKHLGLCVSPATSLHDDGVRALQAQDYTKALACLDGAIAADFLHSGSRFARGKLYFLRKEFEKARMDFAEAVRLSHLAHDAYHRTASDAHLARGQIFLAEGKLDLAINDFTKALDLHRGNEAAIKAQADAYRIKGNAQLAEANEAG